jgi:hypothetical protein
MNYKTDGFIFTPNDENIKTGTHNTMFKFKKQYDNSVDFIVIYEEDRKFVLYIQNRVLYNNYLYTDNVDSELLSHIIHTHQCVVECKLHHRLGKNYFWIPILIRHDKTYSNSFFCYKKTLLNIEENITIDEFYKVSI